jgi:hypothetical protein
MSYGIMAAIRTELRKQDLAELPNRTGAGAVSSRSSAKTLVITLQKQ